MVSDKPPYIDKNTKLGILEADIKQVVIGSRQAIRLEVLGVLDVSDGEDGLSPQVLPLPNKYRKRIEQSLSRFLFWGRHEKLSLSLMRIPVQAQCLILKQTTCILSKPDETSHRHLGYWLGAHLKHTK